MCVCFFNVFVLYLNIVSFFVVVVVESFVALIFVVQY